MISKSTPVVVKPAAASEAVAACDDINLTFYDKWYSNIPVRAFMVFEHPIRDPVETIERGLSQALAHYCPLAGRLGGGAGDVIKCSGDGVPLVAASASCGIKDAKDFSDESLKEELTMAYPPAADGLCRYSDPLVLMQVTVFSCGGFVLGVTWNHAVADGVGMGQFMQAVGELSRGLPSPSVVPFRVDESIILGRPPVFNKSSFLLCSMQRSPMAVLDIKVKASLIDRIKDKYASINSGRPCTTFEAVAAVLWRCRTRVILTPDGDGDGDIQAAAEAITVLVVATNARKRAGVKEGYYGNCVLAQLATATIGTVGNGDVIDLVKIIHGAKHGGVPQQSHQLDKLLQMPDWYNNLALTSWGNIGFEAVDFGAGRPARVMSHPRGMRQIASCTCIPCKDDEYSVNSACVKEDHAAAFLQELAAMHLSSI